MAAKYDLHFHPPWQNVGLGRVPSVLERQRLRHEVLDPIGENKTKQLRVSKSGLEMNLTNPVQFQYRTRDFCFGFHVPHLRQCRSRRCDQW